MSVSSPPRTSSSGDGRRVIAAIAARARRRRWLRTTFMYDYDISGSNLSESRYKRRAGPRTRPDSRTNSALSRSGPAEAALDERQRSHPLSRRRENRVGERGNRRWQRRLAEAGRRVLGLEEVDI